MSSKRRTVFPVAGTYITGVPHAPIIAELHLASQLVATGAYQNAPDDGAEQPESVELTDEQAALLPFFHNVETADEPPVAGEIAGPAESTEEPPPP